MNHQACIERLGKRGIRATANRILVLDALLSAPRAASLAELEATLGTVGRSSIFRVLALFLRQRLVHAIEDGSGSVKYEVCENDSDCDLSDMHAHFYCESCHEISCLRSLRIPPADLPDGFVAHAVNYTVKGLCPRCAPRE